MRFSSLQQWLDWQETLHPKAIDMSLERISHVAVRAGIDDAELKHTRCKIITVAGTNGKGSCVYALEQLLLKSGHSVGAYTSPHVLKYNERIRINGQEASDKHIIDAFHSLDQARGDISLTYFEFATLAAAKLFKDSKLDFWLLEVGLGGRLDSVNIWDADVAIVTSIGIDHTQWLGDNREDIGSEKAGVFRPDQLAISADLDTPRSVIDKAKSLAAKLSVAGQNFGWSSDGKRWSWWHQKDPDHQIQLNLPLCNLPEPSVAAALTALSQLNELPPIADIESVLKNLDLQGRYQQISIGSLNLILDVAHNPHAAELLAKKLRKNHPDTNLIAIFAAMEDKDLSGIIEPLLPLIDHWYLPAIPVNRSADPADIGKTLIEKQTSSECSADMNTALAQIEAKFPNRTIVVFGSFYTVEACLKSHFMKAD